MQRGFTDIDGCLANNSLLQSFIKHKRTSTQPYCVITLDLQKAFDSVSHHTIERALKRLAIDKAVIDTILSSYHDAFTSIFINENEIGKFQFKRGVKQGDPLSPFIFNAVMDEIITKLNGISPTAKCIAYADDLLLLTNGVTDGKILLKECVTLINERNMKINASKCHAISTACKPWKKKLYTHTTSQFIIDNVEIPQLTPTDALKYLGIKYSDCGAVNLSTKQVNENLSKLARSALLKPHQKMILFKDYLLPRFISYFQKLNTTDKMLI